MSQASQEAAEIQAASCPEEEPAASDQDAGQAAGDEPAASDQDAGQPAGDEPAADDPSEPAADVVTPQVAARRDTPEPEEASPAADEPEPVPDDTVAETLAESEPDLSTESSAAEAGLLAASELVSALTSLAALGSRVDDIASAAAELARLRSRDTDLIARLHEDVTRLRAGEIAIALNPVVNGMIKMHDQMVSLGAVEDPASPVGMLHTQLLQILELTCGVHPFTPEPGDRFDAARHVGIRRVPVTEERTDGTVARTIKAGFVRADGSIARVAEVEVHRGPG